MNGRTRKNFELGRWFIVFHVFYACDDTMVRGVTRSGVLRLDLSMEWSGTRFVVMRLSGKDFTKGLYIVIPSQTIRVYMYLLYFNNLFTNIRCSESSAHSPHPLTKSLATSHTSSSDNYSQTPAYTSPPFSSPKPPSAPPPPPQTVPCSSSNSSAQPQPTPPPQTYNSDTSPPRTQNLAGSPALCRP